MVDIKKLSKERGFSEIISNIKIINVNNNQIKEYVEYSDYYDIAYNTFFNETKYIDISQHLGSGSYGSVFSVVDKLQNFYAVKMIDVIDEISVYDEIRLSVLFSKNKIGPKIYEYYII